MKINNLSEHNCIINRYLAEMRDCEYQKNRLLFRNNIKRIGEYEAFEISKTFNYENRDVTTPLGVAQVNFPTDNIVIGTIFRAGLPFHEGFLNIFDHSGNAFVSAYREQGAYRGGGSHRVSGYSRPHRQDAHHRRPYACHRHQYGDGYEGAPHQGNP